MSAHRQSPVPPPDGIREQHVKRRGGVRRHASVLSLLILGAVVAAGLSDHAGGKRSLQGVDTARGSFRVDAPAVSRTGDIIASRLQVTAHQRIGKLVVGIEPALWREITTNSIVPDPADESVEDGLVRLSFAAVEAGKTFELQIAQQINPSRYGTNRGRIVFFDDQRALAEFNLSLKVLP